MIYYINEASSLSKQYFEQKYGKREDYNEVRKSVIKEYDSKVKPLVASQPTEIAIKNYLFYIGYEGGNVSDVADLIHDIISDFTLNIFEQKYLPLMKNNESKVETVQALYSQMKSAKNKEIDDTSKWSIVEKSYVILPNQEKLVLPNFNGSSETKIIPIGNEARWYVGTAIPENELKSSSLYSALDNNMKLSLTKATEKGDLAVRMACPLDAKRSGHCGAVPYIQHYDSAVYLMLKADGLPTGKTVASVLLDDSGKVIESKAPGNLSISEEYHLNLLWLLNHEWVTGTVFGGYAADRNFFLYKVTDDELASHFYNSDKDIANEDKKIRDLRIKYKNGEVDFGDIVDGTIALSLTEQNAIIGEKEFIPYLMKYLPRYAENNGFIEFVKLSNKIANSYEVQKAFVDANKLDEIINASKQADGIIVLHDKIQDEINEKVKADFLSGNKDAITINEDGSIDVDGDVDFDDKALNILPLKFGKVSGSFSCSNNQLTTLEGAPTSVGGRFECSRNQLTTLEGAPVSIGGGINCSNNQLTTLEGGPKSVGGRFFCSSNQLTTLEGSPGSVGGYFDCSNNQLTTLEGGPTSVGGYFNCNNNQLTTLEGSPSSIGEGFSFSSNPNLSSLKGLRIDVSHGRIFYDKTGITKEQMDEYSDNWNKLHPSTRRPLKRKNDAVKESYYSYINSYLNESLI